jgi:periplasmic protein TonB
MKTLTATIPYGYQELRQVHQRYMMLAMLAAIAIQIVAIGTYHLTEWLRPEDPIIVIKYRRPIDIPQPPSIKRESIPESIVSSIPTKAENAFPVPVVDEIADTEKTIESQDILSRRTDPGYLASNSGNEKIVIDESGMDLDPSPGKFEPVEFEPKIVSSPAPEYPEIALKTGIEGNVWLNVLVTKEGRVKKVLILKTDGDIFIQASMDAAKRWVFTPALMNGRPVPVWVSIPFRFRLTGK